MTITLIIFGFFGAGMVLVVYGTIAKNRWGINVDPVACPRCNTPLPQIRQAQNFRQALWGGGTCIKCGAEVDKWGREVKSKTYSLSTIDVRSKAQTRRAVKRRIVIFSAIVFFGLSLLFDWLGVDGHPSTLGGWMVFGGVAVGETAVFTV